MGVDFFSTSKTLIPDMKSSLRLIRAKRYFYMVSASPNNILRNVDCSLCSRRIARKYDHHKKRRDIFAYTPVQFNYGRLLQRLSSFLRKNSWSKKTFPTILQFLGMLLQCIQTLHSLNRLLKIHSGINNLISGKLKYSGEVSQL